MDRVIALMIILFKLRHTLKPTILRKSAHAYSSKCTTRTIKTSVSCDCSFKCHDYPYHVDFIQISLDHLSTVAKLNKQDPMRVVCPKSHDKTSNHTGAFKLSCTGTVNDDNVMELIVEPSVNDAEVTSYSQFWYFCLALTISWIGMAVVVSVGDAICFDLLGKRFDMYGRQRSFGAIGFGLFSLLAGYLVDTVSGQKAYKNYSVIYYLMAIALLPNTLVTHFLEFKPNKTSTSIIRDVGKLFKSARIIVFFLWCIAVGLCTALIWNFLFWHLEDLADMGGE